METIEKWGVVLRKSAMMGKEEICIIIVSNYGIINQDNSLPTTQGNTVEVLTV